MPLPANISDAPFSVGEEIADRYVVERAIAEGGMGLVFAARHRDLDELVAIKFLKPEFARQSEIIGRFAREAKASTKIKSEYVAKVLDVGVSQTRGPYIVMEYLEGEDLSDRLAREGRLPYERAVELILQACEALAAAHALNIIHRDIKPENLFLVKNESDVPTLKLLDFGVSKTALTGKIFGNDISVAKTQSLLGTPLYMSPEQLRGKFDIEPSAEVWSIGAVLYELITGEAPFTGTSVTEVCASVLETVPRSPSERVPGVPIELTAVIMKCLEKQAANRYHTVAELAVALQPFGPKRARMCVERAIAAAKAANQVSQTLQSHASLAPPSGAPSSTRTPSPVAMMPPVASLPPPQSKMKQIIIAGGVVVLLAVAGASFAMRSGSKAPESAPAAAIPPTPTMNATPAATPAPMPEEKATTAEPTPAAGGVAPSASAAAAPAWVRAPAAGAVVPGAFRGPARPAVVSSTPAAKPPSGTASTPAPVPAANARASAIDDRK